MTDWIRCTWNCRRSSRSQGSSSRNCRNSLDPSTALCSSSLQHTIPWYPLRIKHPYMELALGHQCIINVQHKKVRQKKLAMTHCSGTTRLTYTHSLKHHSPVEGGESAESPVGRDVRTAHHLRVVQTAEVHLQERIVDRLTLHEDLASPAIWKHRTALPKAERPNLRKKVTYP